MDSREALMGALELGMDGIEMDVQLTKDTVLVAFHDLDLYDKTGCVGPINSHTWDQLTSCQNMPGADHTYPIQRIDSLLSEAARMYPTAEFTFDIKLNTTGEWLPYLSTFNKAISELAKHPDLLNRILVECQTEDILRLMHEKASEVPLFLYGTEPGTAIEQASALGCAGITMDNDLVSQADVVRAREMGLQVTLFDVSGQWELREALGKRPDRIQLDHDR